MGFWFLCWSLFQGYFVGIFGVFLGVQVEIYGLLPARGAALWSVVLEVQAFQFVG